MEANGSNLINLTADPGPVLLSTVRSVARQVRLAQGAVQGDLEKLVELGHIQKRSPKTDGVIVYGAVARVA